MIRDTEIRQLVVDFIQGNVRCAEGSVIDGDSVSRRPADGQAGLIHHLGHGGLV